MSDRLGMSALCHKRTHAPQQILCKIQMGYLQSYSWRACRESHSLHPGWPDSYMQALGAFKKGLNEIGFVDGQNLAIEYRWAGNEYAQFPSLAADLVRGQ